MGFLLAIPRACWRTLVRGSDLHAQRLAASIAFYALFSLPALLLAAILVAGTAYGEDVARGRLVEQVARHLGEGLAATVDSVIAGAVSSGATQPVPRVLADHAGGLFDKQTATIWNASGGGLDLGTLGGDQSVAYGINDLGVACGFSFTTLGEARAFVWKNGAMIDMNKMIDPNSGWVLVSARDIDESGRIVGDGEFMGSTRAFVALPQCDGSYTV